MTVDRNKMRTSRRAKFGLEMLDERIVPAHSGFLAGGGHVHLDLIKKLPPERPIDVNHHPRPIIVSPPVKFNALPTPARSPVLGKKPPIKPIIVWAPVKFDSQASPSQSPVAGNNPPVQPVIVSAPVKLDDLWEPWRSPVPVTAPSNQPIIVSAPVKPVLLAEPAKPVINSNPQNVSQALLTVYEQYEQNPAGFTGVSSSSNGASAVVVQGDEFGIVVHDDNASEFQSLVSELNGAGMAISTSSAAYGTVAGFLPISEMLAVANFSHTVSISQEVVSSLK